MKINRVFLIGINACAEPENPNVPLEDLANGRPLIEFFSDGFPAARSTVRRFRGQIPGDWADAIMSLSVDSFCSVDHYTAWWSIAEINPSSLSELMLMKDYDLSHALDTLHEVAFAGTCRRTIDTRDNDHSLLKYPYMLYLEPCEALLASGTDTEIQEVVQQLRDLIGRSDKWVAPNNFFGLLLITGRGWAASHEKIVSVGLTPYSRDNPEFLALPVSLVELARYVAFIRILHDMRKRLEALPFHNFNVDDYLNSWKKERRTAGSLRRQVSQGS